jgi:hypothetical protein
LTAADVLGRLRLGTLDSGLSSGKAVCGIVGRIVGQKGSKLGRNDAQDNKKHNKTLHGHLKVGAMISDALGSNRTIKKKEKLEVISSSWSVEALLGTKSSRCG